MGSGATSSTGLSPRAAATLAYAGWWITGLIMWRLERQDAYVRFHAAQACVAFGVAAGVVTLLSTLAAASLLLAPNAFSVWVWIAAMSWTAALLLWGMAMWNAARGRAWRIPLAAQVADRLCRVTSSAGAAS